MNISKKHKVGPERWKWLYVGFDVSVVRPFKGLNVFLHKKKI